MGAIWLPRTLTEQPEYAVPVDRGNDFGRIAALAWMPERESISGANTQFQGAANITYDNQKSVQTYGGTADLGFNVLPYSHPVYSVSTSFSVFFIGDIANVAINASIFDFPYTNGSWSAPYASFGITLSSSGAQNLSWFGGMNGATFTKNELAYVLLPGVHSYAMVWNGGSTMQYYRDGELIGSGSFTAGTPGAIDWNQHTPLVILNESNSINVSNYTNVGSVAPGTLSDIYITPAVLGAAHIARLHSNPWQVFKAPPRRLFIASGTSANNLVGSSVSNESATATLLQSIPLAASSLQIQHATGAMSIGISALAQSAQVQYSAGSLNITIPLNGQAIQQQMASGTSSVGVNLAGQSTQVQPASGTSSIGVDLSGQSSQVQQVSGTANLTGAFSGISQAIQAASGTIGISVTLDGKAVQQALAQAALTNNPAGVVPLAGQSDQIQPTSGSLGLGIHLSGISAQSTGSSALMGVAVNLSGNSLTVHSANGVLATIVPIAGISAQVHSASGGLIIAVSGINAESLQQQGATATISGISLRISLNAESLQQTIGVGALSVLGGVGQPGILYPDLRFTIQALGRSFTVQALGRNFTIIGI